MCTGRRRELIVAFCLGVFLACADVYGQMADRTSVVINEISPSSAGEGVAWIEFFNPRDVPVGLAGLVVRNGDGVQIVIPRDLDDLPDNLPPRAYLVIWFDDAEAPGTVIPDPSGGKFEVWVPPAQADTWIPAHGELSLFEPRGHAPLKLIDHVRWGGPGKPRAVPLAESFGVSNPAAHLRPGESIGLYPVETDTPEHWVIYSDPEACEPENDLNPCEVTPGLPNAIPRPKTFTPASGATIGANTVAFGWVRHPLDKGYRVEMARDPRFAEVMFSLPVQSANVRMGWPLEPGPVYFRVYVLSGDIWSKPSEPYSLTVDSSKCGGTNPTT